MSVNHVAEVSAEYLVEQPDIGIAVGYKQTEIGVIPEDWGVKKIGEIATVYSGGTPNRKIPEYWGGEIPWITTTLIDGGEILGANEHITKKGVESSSAKWAKPGTILMAMYGQGKTRGKAAILRLDATINQACAAIELKDLESTKFVLSYFNYNYENIRELSNSGGQENLSGNIVKGILIPFPSKKEQTAIAKALSDVDALISELEKLISKKQAIKTATMQQLLTGRTRLPQFALHPDGTPKTYNQTELGEIPEDWEVNNLGGVIKSIIDNRGKTPPLSNEGYAMVEVNAVFKQGKSPNLEKVTKYVEKTTFDNWFRDGHPFYGDILLVTVGSAGETSYVNVEGFCIAQNLIGLRIKENIDAEFIYYLTASTPFKKQVEAVLMGAVQPSLKVPHLKKFLFAFPTIKKEQTAIATILSDMDAEIQTLQQRLTKTRHIKQGMMQELLTGKTRLI